VPLIFIAILFIRPPSQVELFAIYSWEVDHTRYLYSPLNSRLMGLDNTAILTVSIWGPWVAVQIFYKREGCLRKLESVLIANFTLQCLELLTAISMTDSDDALRALVGLTVCFLYFRKSKVVAQIFGMNL
jgi:hypothetical protein